MKNYVTALILAFMIAVPHAAHADTVTPPPMPTRIEVPAGFTPFLVAHAVGTQSYLCAPKGRGVAWAPFGPQATLFNQNLEQTLTHFLSRSPFDAVAAFPTWQHSRDSSTVWAQMLESSTDPIFVTPGAIPWLLLQVVGTQAGPTGGDKLTATAYVQRLNTAGGSAPSTGCTTQSDLFKREWVTYEADYYFYQ